MSELHFLKKPYHSEGLTDKAAEKYCRTLARGWLYGNKVAICLAITESDELDIIYFREIRGPKSRDAKYMIVGVAKDDNDALEVVKIIVQDVLDKTGEPKIKQYFNKKNCFKNSF